MKTFLVVNAESRDELVKYVYELDLDKAFSVKIGLYKTSRTLAQNSLYWRWLAEIQKHIFKTMGEMHSTEQIHYHMREKFLPMRVSEFMGKVQREPMSTTRLSIGKFSDYLNIIDYYCNEELQLILTHPEDVYLKAIGE